MIHSQEQEYPQLCFTLLRLSCHKMGGSRLRLEFISSKRRLSVIIDDYFFEEESVAGQYSHLIYLHKVDFA